MVPDRVELRVPLEAVHRVLPLDRISALHVKTTPSNRGTVAGCPSTPPACSTTGREPNVGAPVPSIVSTLATEDHFEESEGRIRTQSPATEHVMIAKMEKLHRESAEQSLDPVFCKRISKDFNRSKGRVGKPVVKWTEVQSWFHNRKQSYPLMDASSPNSLEKLSVAPEGETIPDLSELEFEAKSSKDGAWYDVDAFLAHRFLSSGEAEVRLRFIGFGSEEDEWINVKNAIRVRSLPLEHSECGKVKVGDQERRDQAIYYDVHIVEIQRRVHDIRGCRTRKHGSSSRCARLSRNGGGDGFGRGRRRREEEYGREGNREGERRKEEKGRE
ncbi:hypothetical protein RHGRI_020775 [Rhododendron griersonianum]|uniref:SAWADEE domain-containing protein n=1 Tax=Rhododendron griersonianum TaxID=479676 RepID=A0AAV6JKV5_9ERIC|nr:hypothetical protein RHGRI_020775 [Rhododendron griersonianum]